MAAKKKPAAKKKIELPTEAYILIFDDANSCNVPMMAGIKDYNYHQFGSGQALFSKQQLADLLASDWGKRSFKVFKLDLTKPLDVTVLPAQVWFNDND